MRDKFGAMIFMFDFNYCHGIQGRWVDFGRPKPPSDNDPDFKFIWLTIFTIIIIGVLIL